LEFTDRQPGVGRTAKSVHGSDSGSGRSLCRLGADRPDAVPHGIRFGPVIGSVKQYGEVFKDR
jgi:hypothetical protein